MYADVSTVMKTFGIEIGASNPVVESSPTTQRTEKQDGESLTNASIADTTPEIVNETQIRTAWSREEILQLIHLYKEHEKKFQSTSVKNDKVWHEISQKLVSHSWEQCKNKFKYLKSKYIQKKDNISSKDTGGGNIRFEFFTEMDELFRRHPNVQPIAIASSSRGIANIPLINKNVEENVEKTRVEKRKEHEHSEHQNKKIKTLPTEIYSEIEKMKENGRNARHKENIEKFDAFIQIFREYVDIMKNNQ